MVVSKVDNRNLRSFGLIVGAGFALIALSPALVRHQSPRMWAFFVSIALWTTAFVFPPFLKPFHSVWMSIGEMLGWVNSRIILGVIYYVLIVPIGAIQRMTGKNAVRGKFEPDADTYRVKRAPRPASHMQRQY